MRQLPHGIYEFICKYLYRKHDWKLNGEQTEWDKRRGWKSVYCQRCLGKVAIYKTSPLYDELI